MNLIGNVKILSAIGVIILLVIIGIATNSDNKTTTENKDGQESLSHKNYMGTITRVRLESAKNALDGTGKFTEDQCNKLGELAKQFDPSASYITCTSPSLVYLDTPDTADKKVLTLSDDNYTAKFTTDTEFTRLLDYSFSEETSSGFNEFGGRK